MEALSSCQFLLPSPKALMDAATLGDVLGRNTVLSENIGCVPSQENSDGVSIRTQSLNGGPKNEVLL